jgi:hypothetical protein
MTPPTSGHLTDDEFAECVIEAYSAEINAHLLSCPQCQQELSRFRLSIADFGGAAMLWSESQPRVSLRTASISQARHPLLVHARWVVAAVLLLVVGIPVVLHRDRVATVPADTAAVAASVPDDSDAQIAEDNQLMRSVTMAIGNRDPSPFQEYGLQESRRVRLRPGIDSRTE